VLCRRAYSFASVKIAREFYITSNMFMHNYKIKYRKRKRKRKRKKVRKEPLEAQFNKRRLQCRRRSERCNRNIFDSSISSSSSSSIAAAAEIKKRNHHNFIRKITLEWHHSPILYILYSDDYIANIY
jgi:hypothetical protein